MAHTVFKTSVPYNNIKLAGDVYQWARSEQSSADQAFAYGGNVSMANLQRAAGSNIDPNDGIVGAGGLTDRYGISVGGDVSAGDGVYTAQIVGTNSDFVDTRSYNMSGTPANIRLSRFASYDYTAVADGVDADGKRMAVLNGTNCAVNNNPVQIYKDFPIFIGDVNIGSRYNLLVRSSPFGDKFSSNVINNKTTTTRSTNFASNECHVPLYDSAPSVGTTRQAILGVGRSSSSTSYYRVALHNVTVNSGGTVSLAYSTQNAGNFNFGTSNCAPVWGSYIDDNNVAVYIGRGGSTHKIARITVSGTTATNQNLISVGTTTYGANSGQVASTHNNFGSTKYTFMIKGDTRSSFNNYVKIQAFNTTSGMSTLGSLTTLVTDTGNVKTARMTILATTSSYIYFLYGYSNNTGDVKLRVARFNISNNTYTNLGSTVTHVYNDTNLIQFFNIETLTAVKKTAIQREEDETFIPGQSNEFDERVYWTMVVSTNQNGDPVDTVYGYFDITNSSLAITDSGRTYGRQAGLAINNFMQENTGFLSGVNTRSNAGLPWRLRFGGRSASSAGSSTEIAVAGHALDKVLDWSNGSATDPGSNVYDITGDLFTENADFDGEALEPDWDNRGIWRVANGANVAATYAVGARYCTTLSYNSSIGGTSLNAVGANTYGIWLSTLDHDANDWDDFLMNTVRGYIIGGGDVGITVQTDNSNLTANFTVNSSKVTVARSQYSNNYFISFDYFPGVNWSHSGDSWAFLGNYDTTSAKMAVTFSRL